MYSALTPIGGRWQMLPGPPRSKEIFKGATTDRSVTGAQYMHTSDVAVLMPTHPAPID